MEAWAAQNIWHSLEAGWPVRWGHEGGQDSAGEYKQEARLAARNPASWQGWVASPFHLITGPPNTERCHRLSNPWPGLGKSVMGRGPQICLRNGNETELVACKIHIKFIVLTT